MIRYNEKFAVVVDWESTMTIGELMPRMAELLDRDLYLGIRQEQENRVNGDGKSWEESFRKTVGMLVQYGLTRDKIQELVEEVLEIKPGVEEFFNYLQKHEIPVAIITGGVIDFISEPYRSIATIYSNEFTYDQDGKLNGVKVMVRGNKEYYLHAFCDERGILPERTFVVGDGAGDLGMLRIAGYSVAVENANSGVKKEVDHVLKGENMKALISLIEELYGIEQGVKIN